MNKLEAAIISAISKNGGKALHGELCPLVAALGITRDDTGIMQTATNMAERGLLVKPQRGFYYLPEAWAQASAHDRALARMPYGMNDAGRILYAFWMTVSHEGAVQNAGSIRRYVKAHFQCKMRGNGGFTLLVEDGFLERVARGEYELTAKARTEIKAAFDQAEGEGDSAPAPTTRRPDSDSPYQPDIGQVD